MLGLAEWRTLAHPERLARRAEVNARLAAIFAGQPRDERVRRFAAADAPFAPVLELPEVLAHPQFRHRGLFAGAGGVGLPMKFSAADGSPRGPAPALGEHAEAILRDLDYTPDQIASLASERAVRC